MLVISRVFYLYLIVPKQVQGGPLQETQKPNANFLRKTGVATAVATIAMGATDKAPELPQEVTHLSPFPRVATAEAVPAVAEFGTHPRHHRHFRRSTGDDNERYWYGSPAQLKVIKKLGNTANAKLAYFLAKKQHWFSKVQMACLDNLWFYESKFSEDAVNPASGAGGVPQAYPASKMAKMGKNWRTSATTQVKYGFYYIEKESINPETGKPYGTPCVAWHHWLRLIPHSY